MVHRSVRMCGAGAVCGVPLKPLARKAYERSQHITVVAQREVRPGAYRIVDGVVIEDGGDLLDHRVLREPPPLSGVRKVSKK